MSKIGLVLEGGSFRGIFTAGVLDYLLDREVSFPYVVGVSAGSGNAANFVSKQKERTKKVITHENVDAYFGIGQIRSNGKVLDLDKMLSYDQVPFDFDAFFASETKTEFVVANCNTGLAEYIEPEQNKESVLTLCKASCSVPMMCSPVSIDNQPYLDGSIVDSVPFEHALETGCDKVVVILTRGADEKPTDYSRMRLLINVCYRSTYPKVGEVMVNRALEYERQMKRLRMLEQQGKAFVIRPQTENIGHFENSVDKINIFYQHGYDIMEQYYDKLIEFMEN